MPELNDLALRNDLFPAIIFKTHVYYAFFLIIPTKLHLTATTVISMVASHT